MNPGTYEPILENTFLNSKKIWKKNCMGTSPCFICVHKVSRRNNFFYGLCKKDKTLCRETLFSSTEICLFCRGKTTRHFFIKLCAAHTHLRTCMRDIFFWFLWHFKTSLKCILWKVGAYAHGFRWCPLLLKYHIFVCVMFFPFILI